MTFHEGVSMGLLEVGELPKTQRGTGRKRGSWRGHEEEAKELRVLAERHPDQWGKVLVRATAARAQQISSAIKNGTAADFKPDENGQFLAHVRKSTDQSGDPTNRKGEPITLYDVWARYEYTGPDKKKSAHAHAAAAH
jgi:DNA-binding transcriptional regulator YdaS (Cro superfamily)